MMPRMDGWETYEKIKEINKDQQVAFLTAMDVPDPLKKKVIERGIAEYLTKPFTPEELLEEVEDILE